MCSPFIFAGLLLLLLVSFRCSASASAVSRSASDTSCSFSCGSVYNVSFPFGTSDSCGLPEFRLNCSQSSLLWWPFGSHSPFPVLDIPANNISEGTIVVQNATSASSCSALTNPGASFALSGPNAAFGLEFGLAAANIVLLINCSSSSVHNLKPNQAVPDGFVYSTPHCVQFYTACESNFGENATAPCFEMINEGANLSNVKEKYRCESDTSLYQIPRNKSSELAIEISWLITQSYYNCDSCKKSNGTCNANRVNESFLCNCPNDQNYSTDCSTDNVGLCGDGKNGLGCPIHRKEAPIITGVTVGVVASFVVVFVISSYCRRRRLAREGKDKLSKERQRILSAGSGGKSAKLFTSHEMKRATRNFAKDRLLGSGGFGDVYKGVLDDGTVVAVKSAKVGNIKGIEQVLNEVRILSQVNHRSLVGLLGCCVETEQPLLVYEYISNGTLLEHLKGSKSSFLEWKTRLKIALQTAEGLAYLHSAAKPPVFHRDVKSSNILLDDGLNARVSDFGLSRLAQADLSHISTCAQGTFGYLDPEYYRNHQLTAKSDVYSFGIVLLELVTSQRAIEVGREQDYVNLGVYVSSMAEEGRLLEVMDPRLASRNDSSASQAAASDGACEGGDDGATVLESMRRVAFLALTCLRDRRGERPSMKELAEELQDALNRLGRYRPPRSLNRL